MADTTSAAQDAPTLAYLDGARPGVRSRWLAARRAEQEAIEWAVRIGAMLRALHDGDEDAVGDELLGLSADDVTGLQTAAETLARLAAETSSGRRS